MSPFYANYGRHPVDISGIRTSSSNPTAENFAKHIKDVHDQAKSALIKAAEDMKRFHDRNIGKLIEYAVGDRVFLDGRHIKTIRPTKKLDDKWFGPFEVLEKIGASAYKLKIPKTWVKKGVHDVFNEILLKPEVTPEFESQKKAPPPPPVLIDDKEEWEVEKILDARTHGRWKKLQYLIKWIGHEDATWEYAENTENAQEAIDDFYKEHPGAPRHLDIPQQSLRQIFAYTTPDRTHGWSGRPTLRGG